MVKLFQIEEGSYINTDKIVKIDEQRNIEDVAVKIYLETGFYVTLDRVKWQNLKEMIYQ